MQTLTCILKEGRRCGESDRPTCIGVIVCNNTMHLSLCNLTCELGVYNTVYCVLVHSSLVAATITSHCYYHSSLSSLVTTTNSLSLSTALVSLSHCHSLALTVTVFSLMFQSKIVMNRDIHECVMTDTVTHSLTRSLTHSLTHSLCHSLTWSLTHWVTHSLATSLYSDQHWSLLLKLTCMSDSSSDQWWVIVAVISDSSSY